MKRSMEDILVEIQKKIKAKDQVAIHDKDFHKSYLTDKSIADKIINGEKNIALAELLYQEQVMFSEGNKGEVVLRLMLSYIAEKLKNRELCRTVSEEVFEGLELKNIPNNRQALFHAIGCQLDQDTHTLMQIVAEHMSNDTKYYENFWSDRGGRFKQHIKAVSNGAAWGSHIEIYAIQRITNRPIIIIKSDANPIIPDDLVDYNGDPIFIYHNGANHYDAFALRPGYDAKEILKRIQKYMKQDANLTFNPKIQFAEQLREHTPNDCYFVYAWKTDKNYEKEAWVKSFLIRLYRHLKQTSIPVYMDIKDNPQSNDIYQYMEQTSSSDFVLLFGTESLMEKVQQRTPAVCMELIHVKRKRDLDREKGVDRVLPILLTGTMETAFPAEYELSITAADWREKGYLNSLKTLVYALYGFDNNDYYDDFEKIWEQGINEKLSGSQQAFFEKHEKFFNKRREMIKVSHVELKNKILRCIKEDSSHVKRFEKDDELNNSEDKITLSQELQSSNESGNRFEEFVHDMMWGEDNSNFKDKKTSTNTDQAISSPPDIEGLKYVKVPEDGHCLYHAVCLYIAQDQQALRNLVAENLENKIDFYRNFIDLPSNKTVEDYIHDIKIGVEWAGHIEIEILMNLLDRPILVVSPSRRLINEADRERFSGEPIFVYYNGHDHYDGLILDENYNNRVDEILNQLSLNGKSTQEFISQQSLRQLTKEDRFWMPTHFDEKIAEMKTSYYEHAPKNKVENCVKIISSKLSKIDKYIDSNSQPDHQYEEMIDNLVSVVNDVMLGRLLEFIKENKKKLKEIEIEDRKIIELQGESFGRVDYLGEQEKSIEFLLKIEYLPENIRKELEEDLQKIKKERPKQRNEIIADLSVKYHHNDAERNRINQNIADAEYAILISHLACNLKDFSDQQIKTHTEKNINLIIKSDIDIFEDYLLLYKYKKESIIDSQEKQGKFKTGLEVLNKWRLRYEKLIKKIDKKGSDIVNDFTKVFEKINELEINCVEEINKLSYEKEKLDKKISKIESLDLGFLIKDATERLINFNEKFIEMLKKNSTHEQSARLIQALLIIGKCFEWKDHIASIQSDKKLYLSKSEDKNIVRSSKTKYENILGALEDFQGLKEAFNVTTDKKFVQSILESTSEPELTNEKVSFLYALASEFYIQDAENPENFGLDYNVVDALDADEKQLLIRARKYQPFIAVIENRLDHLKQLIKCSDEGLLDPPLTLDQTDMLGRTLLHWAARKEHDEIAAILIEQGAQIDIKDCQDKTPFSIFPLSSSINRNESLSSESLERKMRSLSDGLSLRIWQRRQSLINIKKNFKLKEIYIYCPNAVPKKTLANLKDYKVKDVLFYVRWQQMPRFRKPALSRITAELQSKLNKSAYIIDEDKLDKEDFNRLSIETLTFNEVLQRGQREQKLIEEVADIVQKFDLKNIALDQDKPPTSEQINQLSEKQKLGLANLGLLYPEIKDKTVGVLEFDTAYIHLSSDQKILVDTARYWNLHFAVMHSPRNECLSITRILLSLAEENRLNIDVNSYDSWGYTPLDRALSQRANRENGSMCVLLLRHGARQSNQKKKRSRRVYNETINRVMKVAQHCLNGNAVDKYQQVAECYGLVKALIKQWPKTEDNKAVRKEYKSQVQELTLKTLQHFITYSLRLAPSMESDYLSQRLKGYSTALWALHQSPKESNDSAQAWVTEKTRELTQLFHDIVTFCLDMLRIHYLEQQTDLAVICLGSLATAMATGYSDIEYLILLSPERAQANRAKLAGLSDLVELLVTSLGETPIYAARAMIQSEFQREVSEREWLLKKVIHKGVRIDTAKQPQARNYVIELTGSVESFLSQEAQWLFQPGNHIASSLLCPSFVLGNKNLLESLQEGIENRLRQGHYQDFLYRLWNHDDQAFRFNVIIPLEKQRTKKQLSKSWSPKFFLLYPLCILRDTYWSLMQNPSLNLIYTSNTWTMLDLLSQTLPKIIPDYADEIISCWKIILNRGMLLRLKTEVQFNTSSVVVNLKKLEEENTELLQSLYRLNQHIGSLRRYCGQFMVEQSDKKLLSDWEQSDSADRVNII